MYSSIYNICVVAVCNLAWEEEMTLLEKVCLIISLLCLTALFSIQSKPPKDDHLAGPEIKRVMHEVHGIWFMECRGDRCKFKRNGRTVWIK